MVAMPYILVNMVLSLLSLILLCLTSAALLSKYSWANRYLPARLRRRRVLAFLGHAFVMALVLIGFVAVVRRIPNVSMLSVCEVILYIALVLAAVLTYQFLDGRFIRGMPRIPRRLVMAACSILLVSAGAIAMMGAVFHLFVIR